MDAKDATDPVARLIADLRAIKNPYAGEPSFRLIDEGFYLALTRVHSIIQKHEQKEG